MSGFSRVWGGNSYRLKEVNVCCMGKGRLGLKVVGNIKRNRSGINFHRDKNC